MCLLVVVQKQQIKSLMRDTIQGEGASSHDDCISNVAIRTLFSIAEMSCDGI